MIVHVKDKLTAAQVRALPVGSPVDLHGRDRHGYSTVLHCEVVQSGKKKVLAYDWNGERMTKPIRELSGSIHYYTAGHNGW